MKNDVIFSGLKKLNDKRFKCFIIILLALLLFYREIERYGFKIVYELSRDWQSGYFNFEKKNEEVF